MANKTQCPNCRAIYKITDEQFRLSKGKVRCGSCRAPFQAKILDEAYIRPSRSHASRKSPDISKSRQHTDDSTDTSKREGPSITTFASDPISTPKAEKTIDDSESNVKQQLEEEQTKPHAEPSYDDLMQDYQENVARVVTDKQPAPIPFTPSVTQPLATPDDDMSFGNSFESELTIELEGEDSTWLDYSELSISPDTLATETESTESQLSAPAPTENQHDQAELALPEADDIESDTTLRQESTLLISESFDPDLASEVDSLVDQALLQQEQEESELEIQEKFAPPRIATQTDEHALEMPPIEPAGQPLEAPFAIAAKRKGKSRWLMIPLLLMLGIILCLGLMYQLWHKQMLPWIGIDKIADTVVPIVAPIAEPLIGKFTEKFEVSIPVRRDLSKLQLLSARTEAHPTRSSTTLLRVRMINHAEIRQPYPWLEVSLTDQEGRLVARRALSPDNYLHNNDVDRTIGPKELKPVTIEFLTFPKQVEGYELKLLNN